MADLNVVNGKVFIPEIGIQKVGISIEAGKVICIAAEGHLPAAQENIDASGMYVLPGLISPHAHLGFFKGFATECKTETRSALVGGVTTIGCYVGMPNPYSAVLPGIEQDINSYASADVIVHLIINTKEQMKEIQGYARDFGVTSFKFYMYGFPGFTPTQTNHFILEGFMEVAKLGEKGVCCVHAEDPSMMEAGKEIWKSLEQKDLVTWSDCNPKEAEELACIVASYLAKVAKVKLNILHLCTGIAADRLASIKRVNPYVNVEAFVLALALTKHSEAGLRAKWSPAIRDEADQEALWQGVRDGIIDTFGCDTVAIDSKTSARSGGGTGGLDALMLPILLTEGFHRRRIPLENILKGCTLAPARLFGVYPQKGTIAVGSDADLCIVDLDKEFQADHRKLHSMVDWSLFNGKTLRGKPVITIKSGKVAMREGEVLLEPGYGKHLRRSL